MGSSMSATRSFFNNLLAKRGVPSSNIEGYFQGNKIGKNLIVLLSLILGYGILVKMKEHFAPTQEQHIRNELAKFEKEMNLAPGSLDCMLEQWIEDGKRETDI